MNPDLERCAKEQLECGEYIRSGAKDQDGARMGAGDWLAEEAIIRGERGEYEEFLQGKSVVAPTSGFELELELINPKLRGPEFGFQADVVRWALRGGRRAIWADTGLGKTGMQLEWAFWVCSHCGPESMVLILAPLGVVGQTHAAGLEKFGIASTIVRSQEECRPGINITNYDLLHKFDTTKFVGVVLDESSILKSYTGATKQKLVEAFRDTPYRLACTATPAPNDLLELGNHAEFLGIMPSNEMISRWFINDSMEFGNYRLKKHAAKDYYRWLCSWAVSFSKPSDLNYEDGRFQLPELEIIHHIVSVADLPPGEDKNGQAQMFRGASLSATNMHAEMRITADRRAQKVHGIVTAAEEIPDDPWLIWVNTDYEADAVSDLLNLVEVRGPDKPAEKERKLLGFAAREFPILLTKPKIAGFGMNWQHCSNVVFMGLSYSYESLYQAIRRCWRYGQTRKVTVHIVAAESEGSVLAAIQRKEKEHLKMKAEMNEAMREEQLANIHGRRELREVPPTVWQVGDRWKLGLGDCVDATSGIDSNSIGYTLFSPPFSNLYIYSDSIADMGNSKDDEEFLQHFNFLVEHLHRVTIPGRLCSVHCKDLPLYRGRDGAAGLRDFPGAMIRCFERRGWILHSRCTIWKDPVIEMQRTKNHGLLYKELCKDSSCSRQGMADYLITFRKWNDEGDFPNPVNAGADSRERFEAYVGLEPPDPTEIAQRFNLAIPRKVNGKWPNFNPFANGTEAFRKWSIAVWQKYASPVWFDIDQTDVLNYQMAKGNADEKHICPLQLQVIERAIHLWSNSGDLVYSPFGGIGSEPASALKLGRRACAVELKPEYFRFMVQHCENVKRDEAQAVMFGSELAAG